MRNVRELIETRAAELGDREYLLFQDQSFSFARLDQRVNQTARGLASLGAGKGSRVAVLLKNSPEFIFVWWALLKLGAVMVPVNLRLTAGEAAYIINHSEAEIVVLGDDSLPLLGELRRECRQATHWLGTGANPEGPSLKDFYLLPVDLPPVDIAPDDEAVILYTSGTTGFPKGVVHTHANYLRVAACFAASCGLAASDRLLTSNPLFHVNAQFYSCLGTLWAGAVFVLAEKFSASRMWEWTRRYQANKVVMLLALTTILYNREPRADDADNPVELVVAGGAPQGCYRDFERRFGVRLQTIYSLTESPLALMGRPGRPATEDSVGVPMTAAWPGLEHEVRIFDDADRELPPDETGWIVIRNQAMMKEYLKDPQATAETLAGGWLHTGDRGRCNQRGDFFFLGRGKDMIRKKGENISAVEVENVLNASPDVVEAAVLGVSPPDAAGEEEIMAFVVRSPEAPPGWDDLAAHCRERLADFKTPRFWLATAELPKNATNRVLKDRLGDRERPEETPGTYDMLKGETVS